MQCASVSPKGALQASHPHNTATAGLPWELVSDEAVIEYERMNLPPDAWPPTSWLVSWASGGNAFDLEEGRAPIELRWLVFRCAERLRDAP
jgi:hypothetical protein